MPTLQARTRVQLRLSVGYNAGAVHASTTSSAGNAGGTTFVDNTLPGGDDEHNGKWAIATSGNNIGEIRRVSDYVASSFTCTVASAFTNQVATSVTYELWDQSLSPAKVHDFLNQAIIAVSGLAYDPIENISFHGDGKTARFDIPTGIAMLSRLEYRERVKLKIIDSCDAVWAESAAPSGVTRSADTKDKKQGSASNKFVVAASVAAAQVLSSKAITSANLSDYDYVEFWIKSTVATASGDLQLLLDNTAAVASALETLAVPALTANVWTYVRILLANPKDDTAIISVGLRYQVDIGAATIWIDDVKAIVNDSAIWAKLDKWYWSIDKEAKDLILTQFGRDTVGYNLIKLIGGDIPVLLSSETSATEINDTYLIAYATALALTTGAKGPTTDPDAKGPRSNPWFAAAERAKAAFPFLIDARTVD